MYLVLRTRRRLLSDIASNWQLGTNGGGRTGSIFHPGQSLRMEGSMESIKAIKILFV